MLVDGMSIIDVKLISDHDAKVLKDSGIIEQLRGLKDLLENSDDDDDVYGRLQQYSRIMIYGDPAYRNLDVVKRKSKGLRTLWQRVLDKSMQPSRATVEDAFAYLVITFPSATLDARAQKRTPPCGGYVFWPRPYDNRG